MTKEYKIKEAYGCHWGKVSSYVDENGWMFWDFLSPEGYFKDSELEYQDHTMQYWRPKSLSGIENNNGWHKIDSEEDLPKVCDDFLVYNKENEIFVKTFIPNSIVSSIWLKDITHYQPIEKPKPPVY